MKLVSRLVFGVVLSGVIFSAHAAHEQGAERYRQALIEFRDQGREKLQARIALFNKERNWIMAWFAYRGEGKAERDERVEQLEEAYGRDMEALMRDCLLWRSSQWQLEQKLPSRL
jgi:hypothetical protein